MKCQNFIHTRSLVIMLSREENKSVYSYEDKERLKVACDEIVKHVSKQLFEQVFKTCVMFESHQVTINVVGQFEPYSYDRRKKNEAIMKYENAAVYEREEAKLVVGEVLEMTQLKAYVYFGISNFELISNKA